MNTRSIEKISGQLNASLKAKPLTLYELAEEMIWIDQQLEESDGELTPEIEAMLEGLQAAFTAKVEAVCVLRQNLVAEANVCAEEALRLTKRAEAATRKANSLKQFLFGAFRRAGETKIKTPRWTVYIQASPPSIRWTRRVDELPGEYRRVKIEPNIERAHEVRRTGEQLPDGFVVEQSEHLRIR